MQVNMNIIQKLYIKNEVYKVSDEELEKLIGYELKREQIFKDIFNKQNVEQIYNNIHKEMSKVEKDIDNIQIFSQRKQDTDQLSKIQNIDKVTLSYFTKQVDSQYSNVKNRVSKLKNDVQSVHSKLEQTDQKFRIQNISFNNKKSTPGFVTTKNEYQKIKLLQDPQQSNLHVTSQGDFMILGQNSDVPNQISQDDFRFKNGFFNQRQIKRGQSIGGPVSNNQPISQKNTNFKSQKQQKFPQVNYNFKVAIKLNSNEKHANTDVQITNSKAKSQNPTIDQNNTDINSSGNPSDSTKQAFVNKLAIKMNNVQSKQYDQRAKTPENSRYINDKFVTERGLTSQPLNTFVQNHNDTINSVTRHIGQTIAEKLNDSNLDVSTTNDINLSVEKNNIYSADASFKIYNNSFLNRK